MTSVRTQQPDSASHHDRRARAKSSGWSSPYCVWPKINTTIHTNTGSHDIPHLVLLSVTRHVSVIPTRSDATTHSKHTTAPDTLLLLLEPRETLKLEREELDLQVRRLFRLLWYSNFDGSFQITPHVTELWMMPLERESGLLSLGDGQFCKALRGTDRRTRVNLRPNLTRISASSLARPL